MNLDEKRARNNASVRRYRQKHPETRLKWLKGDGRGRIYFVQMGRTIGPIKIGFTRKRVETRMAELQVGNPELLVLLGARLGTKEEEQALHKEFRDLHLRGEWFAFHHSLLEKIQQELSTITSSSEAMFPPGSP